MSNEKFSVLMSLYEKELPSNLDECLKSIAYQTLKADEIILVFDGPVGESLCEIVKYWDAHLPLRIVRLNVNRGLGEALNYGLNACSNELIVRMDTDDICRKQRFEKLLSSLTHDKELVLIGSYIEEFSCTEDNITGLRIVPLSHSDIIHKCKIKNPFNHMSVAFRKSAVLKVGGYMHHLYMEDYNLWLRMISDGGKVQNLPEPLVLVRAGGELLRRRRGYKYLMSEIYLSDLKVRLGIQKRLPSLFILLLRGLPRVLPLSILKLVYITMRKNKREIV